MLTQKEKEEAKKFIQNYKSGSPSSLSSTHSQRMERLKKITGETIETPKTQKPQDFLSKASGIAEKGLGIASELSGVAPLFRAGARPFVSAVRGIQGNEKPVNLPFGDVKPYSKMTPGESAMEGITIATAGLPVEKALVAPLKGSALKLYQSALKISKSVLNQVAKSGESITQASTRLAKTGLEEKVWLTSGGAENTAMKIDDLEEQLGQVISKAGAEGKKISLNGLKSYIDEVKNLFKDTFDVNYAKKASDEIESIYKGFSKKYGKELPIEAAQKIKTATYSSLKKAYGELTGASQEAQKAGVRYLKEKIVEAAPSAGGINKRLSALYDLDKALDSFTARTRKLNLLGLPSKLGGAVGGLPGLAIGKGLEVLESPAWKSGAGILLNQLAKKGGAGIKAIKMPTIGLLNSLINKIKEKNQ